MTSTPSISKVVELAGDPAADRRSRHHWSRRSCAGRPGRRRRWSPGCCGGAHLVGASHLIAPRVTPEITQRWANTYHDQQRGPSPSDTTRTPRCKFGGELALEDVLHEAAASPPGGPTRRPAEAGSRFQAHRHVRIPTGGVHRVPSSGKMILRNTVHVLAAAMMAASSSSMGMELM